MRGERAKDSEKASDSGSPVSQADSAEGQGHDG